MTDHQSLFHLVLPVELPPGLTPEEFLADTTIEYRKGHGEGRNNANFRYVINGSLDEYAPKFGEKEMRPVA